MLKPRIPGCACVTQKCGLGGFFVRSGAAKLYNIWQCRRIMNAWKADLDANAEHEAGILEVLYIRSLGDVNVDGGCEGVSPINRASSSMAI